MNPESAEKLTHLTHLETPENVSLAFRLVFQRADRTLTEKEVTKATDRVVKMLSHRFGGELR